jgi:hypothetical protein
MAGRPRIFENLQIGKEATPGTAVGADIQPLSTMIMPTTVMPSEDVQASGQRADVDVINGKEHTEADISGKLSLVDLFFWFGSALGRTNVAGNVGVIDLDQEKAYPVAYTVEYGSAAGLFKFPGAQVSELSLSLTPNQIGTFQGKMIGGKSVETGARTASPNRLSVQHAGPKQVSVWIADTAAALANAGSELKAADGLLDAQFTLSNLVEPVFTVSEDDTFAFLSETKPTVSTKLTMVRSGAKFTQYMADLRSGALKYLRILAKGPTVGGVQSLMEVITPFKFREPAASENQGQFCGDLVAHAVYDGSAAAPLGTALRVRFTGAWVGASGAGSLGVSGRFDNDSATTDAPQFTAADGVVEGG